MLVSQMFDFKTGKKWEIYNNFHPSLMQANMGLNVSGGVYYSEDLKSL